MSLSYVSVIRFRIIGSSLSLHQTFKTFRIRVGSGTLTLMQGKRKLFNLIF